MNLRASIEGIAVVVVLALAGLAGRSWLEEHDARLELKAQMAAQGELVNAAQQRISDRDSQLQKTIADYEALRQQKMTPQQVVREIPQLIPLPKALAEPLPDAPTVQIPVEDMAVLRDRLLQCKECDDRLATAKGDALDVQSKLEAVTRERDLAVNVVKGGTKWQRFQRGLKQLAIGAGIGAGLALAAHH